MASPSQVIAGPLVPASGQVRQKSARAWWKVILGLTAMGVLVWEVMTSFTQAHFFTAFARKAQYRVEIGPARQAQPAPQGPYDQRLGYARLDGFRQRLTERGYEIERQARWSEGLAQVSSLGLFLPFEEKTRAGLLIRGRDGTSLREEMWPQRVYREFHEVPDVIWQSLLYIENRELLSDVSPFRNPAVEWDRLGSAVVGAGKKIVDPSQPSAGGSTLATQLEKVRHSPGGRTGSANEKVRQMLSASLRAYQDGPRTRGSRERIVKDYVNSLPLGSARGYGEVIGLGDALWAWYGTEFGYANGLLRRIRERDLDRPTLREAASIYRQSLGMLLAVNRPGYYLQTPAALNERVDNYLRLLARAGVIAASVRDE
ncbi:MAG: transglycosylase domain-containing protein, partial [Bryobacteraceae bacterium]|nr:transglycosylase domain-containing protein [Bryobacteraceae bacterium]